ncbi:EAL domain-containing protein [Thiomicrospira sp. ALE5]|uniref:EAL domain-containing protein n=1 Tax=Thiomicrospira sp. ALE5 TaxID=748650 RepID=UPI0008E80FE8|nr:EAL domain-containing protein [Thiomicrospira sp. ALE5]SFR52528.1 PAS domain S-box-containing protein/diguanylate cyclase (GGDEF) domain-containing protein [Thiomicrospira sp. ALE5]
MTRLLVNPLKLILACVFLTLPIAAQALVEQSSDVHQQDAKQQTVYQLAVLAFQDKSLAMARWQPLADYLTNKIDHAQFELAVYHNEEMEQAVASGAVDFVLTQPSQYVLLTYRHQLSSPLASLLNKDGGQVTEYFGGVIFTLAERDDIANLKDIKGKRVAGASITGLGSYQMQAFELLQHGIRLQQDANVTTTGQPQRRVVEAVLAGEVDVGFVRTGVLEALSARELIDLSQLKILNQQAYAGFPFITSTRLYPEWAFAAMPEVDSEVIRLVAAALLAIPSHSPLSEAMQIGGFTIAGDYRTIDNLMRELRLEPFDDFALQFQDVVAWWLIEIVIGLVLVFSMLAFVVALLIQRQGLLNQERRRLKKALTELRLLNQAVEQSPESIVITDLNGQFRYMNPMFEQTTGYTEEEVLGKSPSILSSGLTPKSVYQDLWATLKQGKVWLGELSNKRKNGEIYPSQAIISPVKDEQGRATHYLAIQRDISSRKQREQRINELLYRDPVTGLANRNRIIQFIDKQLFESSGRNAALILVNIARFKFINQIDGADVGDAVLVAVGQRLNRLFTGQGNLVARLAADEFAVFCQRDGQKDEALDQTVQTIVQAFNTSVGVRGKRFDLNVAVGVASLVLSKPESSQVVINQLFENAGVALKQIRQSSGTGVCVFDQQLLQDSLAKHQLQNELASGILRDELRLFVQPQVNHQRQLMGLECLVRWQHPDHGLMAPGTFIPLAEESDLILGLGDWVLRHACLILAQMQQSQPAIIVAVNISPRQFMQASFVASVKKWLAESAAQPNGLMIEITESLFLDELQMVVNKMNELKSLGVQFSIDDFGTGYSSLSYLQQLPVDELKIDRSFILTMTESNESVSLVPTIYAMAQQMNLRVIAEGIETPAQAAQLAQFEHLELQGYLFGKPAEFKDWFAQWSADNSQ